MLEGERQGDRPGSTLGLVHRPAEASSDLSAAQSTVGGTETILDVQTHLLDYELVPEGPDFWSEFPYKNCGEAEQRDCFGVDHWMEELFVRSDTAMVVLSAVPIVGDADPLSIDVMERALGASATELCGDGRVLLQGHAVPNVGRIEAALDGIRELHRVTPDRGVEGVHAHARAGLVVRRRHRPGVPLDGRGDRHDGRHSYRRRAQGLADGNPAASPADIGPAAVAHPDVRFVVYHSGYEGNAEGPSPRTARASTVSSDRLRNAGVAAGKQRVRRTRIDVACGDGQTGSGRARAGQAPDRWGRTTSCGAPTRSGTARRRTRSRPSVRSS